ncbi:MAG: hypothetical protein JST60_05095 [Chloroflexi bacterium SZAS-1]|nr:hypothetical protein [Chloroflexi bacterium SZAS-1]
MAASSQIVRPWHIAPLLMLLALIIFPFEWLGMRWHALGWFITHAFPSDTQHAIGHATLFALLGGLALATFPSLRTQPRRYVLLVLAGVAQEAAQLLFKQRPLAFDDGRDLAVDAVGLALAWGLFWLIWRAQGMRIPQK